MTDSLDEKTFILGVGVQKAGTSWLFKYLDDLADCYMSPIKELHYFDTVHRPDLSAGINPRFLRDFVGQIREKEKVTYDPKTGFGALTDRVSMIYDPGAYRRYFEDRVPEDIRFFGEVTPAYALLPKKGFQDIRNQFPKRRILLILRDPIERHYSLMRMKEKKGKIESAHDAFLELLDWKGAAARADYEPTIQNLSAVFSEDELLISFYEDLFNDNELRRICEFIGLPFQPGNYDVRVNAGGEAGAKKKSLTDSQRSQARERLAPVYDFCQEFFGDRLPSKWHV